MVVIIDGYNLMPNIPVKGDTFEKQRLALIAELQEFVAINPSTVILVFDGHKNPSMHRGNETHGKIRVIYSAKDETADDVIEDMIANRKLKAKEYLIVSSDRRLQDYAEEHDMRWMSSQKFAEYFE
ncbi:MAG TPA: NYN domain-containing protein [Candidatus Goldiibacteriota bacterium]|nr:NYN domain-containing protein [Candidatus Goldiibacteriota bacterium]